MKSECYRAAALASKGDYPNALAVAKSVAAIKLAPERAASEGGQLLLWEGRTLSARLLMRRSLPGDALLVAGKGHESGQIIAGEVYPFDDVEQASVAVAALDGII